MQDCMNNYYPELEANSSIEEILSDNEIIVTDRKMKNPFQDDENIAVQKEEEEQQYDDDDDDEEQEVENNLDITCIHDDEHLTNYDGVHVVDNNNTTTTMQDDYISAVSLKRNLSETFERHAKEEDEKKKMMIRNKNNRSIGSESSGSSSITAGSSVLTSSQTSVGTKYATNNNTATAGGAGGVRAKIKAFEEKNVIIKPKNGNNNKVRFDTNHNRPPTAPVPSNKFQSSSTTNGNNTKQESSLLSVFLRIRPPSVSNKATDNDQTACHNTVEVLPPKSMENDDDEFGDEENKKPIATSIRTYPPLQSNTSKAVRGQHQLHCASHNTDLIFHASSKNSRTSAMDNAVKGVKEFDFNQVFDLQSTQEQVFESVAIPLVDGLFPNDNVKIVGDKAVGKSALLFSYGITNAGKTYTIMGKDSIKDNHSKDLNAPTTSLDEEYGIIPRTIERMLSKINTMENENLKYQLNVSFMEIYNEQIYDLLPDTNEASTEKKLHSGPGVLPFSQNSLRIRESKNGNVHVRGLAKYHISSLAQGLELVKKAKTKRHTSNNKINNDSSRSHSICQFELVALPMELSKMNDVGADNASIRTSSSAGYSSDDDCTTQSSKRTKSATFWIVDLAGSERSKRTGAFARSTRQKEAALINSSLMKLMRCFQTLKQNQSSSNMHLVPFRESKLTHLFMGHLTGAAASRTSMIVNINPCIADFDETQHVLSYATVAKTIRISESDYNRKRRAIQIAGNGVDHFSLSNHEKKKVNSPPRKIARIVKKLSPRAALARLKEQQKDKSLKRKHKDEGYDTNKANPRTKVGKVNTMVGFKGKNKYLEHELEELRKALTKSKDEVERYQKEAVSLRGKLIRCEADIRKEIYEETEHYHECIHQQHNEIVSRLKQQIAAASQTPSKSTRKVQRDKADAMIDELMDKVDECEEEMARMDKSHKEELAKLKDSFVKELIEKDKKIETLKSEFEHQLLQCNEEIKMLNEEVEEKSRKIEVLKDNCSSSNSGEYMESSDSVASYDEIDEISVHNKENEVVRSHHATGPSPRLRRLPRQRCSEVACAKISPPKDDPISSSTKKKRKGLSKIRSPFKSTKTNVSNSNDEISDKINNQYADSDSKKDIIYPSSQPEFDEVTGFYQRPRGRAPLGRMWDAKAGGWRRFGKVQK